MGSVYRSTYTRSLPEGAELLTRKGKRFARWVDAHGTRHTGELTAAGDRVLIQSRIYTAKYRDGFGRVVTRSTGCRDKAAATHVLSALEAEAEKVRAGVISAEEVKTGHQADRPFASHLAEYLEHLEHKRVRGRTVSPHYRRNVKSRLDRLTAEMDLGRLSDLTADRMSRWLTRAEDAGMAAATRNEYLTSAIAFCNWAIQTHRLAVNPLAKTGKADARSDGGRRRRALETDEISRLLEAARLRPVAEFGRETTDPSEKGRTAGQTWAKTPVTWENVQEAHRRGREHLAKFPARLARLDMLGRERALFYLVAVTTGLRRKEQSSLKVDQLHLDAPYPFADLAGRDSKSGHGATIPLRGDVVDLLKRFLADRLTELRRRILVEGRAALPGLLPAATPVFPNPPTIRVFDRDLLAAGIAQLDEDGYIVKTDPHGRTVDLHALRHTFGTHLSKAGVSPRTAQAAMRHSRIDLTMNVYTDPRLLDVAGAVNALPDFSPPRREEKEVSIKTGTFDGLKAPREHAPDLVPDLVPKAVHDMRGRQPVTEDQRNVPDRPRAQVLAGREKRKPRPSPDRGCPKRAMRFELTTFTLATRQPSDATNCDDSPLGHISAAHALDHAPDSQNDVAPTTSPDAPATQAGKEAPLPDRLELIADLLADLPQTERREVIAELPPSARAAIARLLIGSRRDSN